MFSKLTRAEVVQLLGSMAPIFDCPECAEGVFIGTGAEHPRCNRCGEPMPAEMTAVATSLCDDTKVA